MATAVSDGSAAAVVTGSWASTANAFDGSGTTYAIAGPSVATHALDITGYGFDVSVPSDATLTSVVVNVSQFVGNASRWNNPTVRAYDGATPLGSAAVTLTERTVAGNEDVTLTGLTLANVRSANFKIRFSAQETSTTGSTTCSLGWCNVTVTYTPAAVTHTRSASLTASPSIAVSGVRVPAVTVHSRSASLTATPSITVAATQRIVSRSASLTGAPTIAVKPQRVLLRSAALAANPSISTSASFFSILERAASLTATPSVTVSAFRRGHVRSVSLAGSPSVVVAGGVLRVFERSASLAGSPSITVSGEIAGLEPVVVVVVRRVGGGWPMPGLSARQGALSRRTARRGPLSRRPY